MSLKNIRIYTASAAVAVLLTACGSAGAPEATPLPTVQLAPAITAPPTPTPTPKPSIGPYYEPTVTKSPTGEDKVEGSSVYFSSFAEDAVRCDWEFVRDEGYLTAEQAAVTFEGLIIAGASDNFLVLGNIPLELDGWSVRCRFTGTGEATVYSEPAQITVSERMVKIHGQDRRTVKGTGNVEGYGAVIDFEGENWWDAEEYSGALFTLLPGDRVPELSYDPVEFCVYPDGSVSLTVGERTYLGKVSPQRLGGYSASAVLSPAGSQEEITVFFDYTAQSQDRESWDRIFFTVPLPPPEKPAEQEAENADAEEAAVPDEEAEDSGPVTVQVILTRSNP